MLKQIGTQKQHFNVLPQQIQLLKLFHLTTLELQQRIQEELNDNPLLEEEVNDEDKLSAESSKDEIQEYQDEEEYAYDDIPDYKLEHNNYLAEDTAQRPFAELHDFRKALKEQMSVHLSNEKETIIAEFLIDSLDEQGFLDADASSLADDISFQNHIVVEAEEVERMRLLLQQIDPCGIGCRTIKEFLIFQLQAMEQEDTVKYGISLLSDHFQDLSNRNMEKIANKIQISEDELRDVIRLIATLKRKPFTELQSSVAAPHVIPDFIITENDDKLEVSLYRQRSSTLFINQSLTKMLEKEKKADKATVTYLKGKLNSAQWFVDAIKQRETTMMKIMTEILKFQADYFREGDIRFLKPMILKNIAEKIGMDISTVSRITCNKYADTPFGTILLKSLFSEGVENEQGEMISNRVIQTAIEEVVKTEDKHAPYTDQQLVSILSGKGFDIARRTVSKYREHLQIPIAQRRAAWR
ncbi:MAG: RNA polymerase factor sigma-54 [Cyclobacteriaceae bacterium]|nr:RNA polymerase factor sigma-54 [Cyclobacteriaceae bacterium]